MGKVMVYAREADASSFYRLVEPAAVLVENGYDVECVQFGSKAGTVAVDTEAVSTVVVNRPIQADMANVVCDLAGLGLHVVVDMDDDFDHLRPNHSMFGVETKHLHRACKAASLVTVTTPALLKIYGYGHGVVVPQAVPQRYFDVKKTEEHDGFWIGWSGTISSHPNDLVASSGGIAKALHELKDKSVNASLAYVGPHTQKGYVAKQLGYRGDTFSSGWMRFSDYPKTIAQFDAGVVPLEGCSFNDAKSCLKGLELAALGVPFVASPAADYRRLAGLGAGILAGTRNDWARALTRLALDESYRSDVIQRGRETALKATVEAQHAHWVASWQANIKTGLECATVDRS